MRAPRFATLAAVVALSGVLAACASGPRYAAAPGPPPPPLIARGDQPPEQAAVVAPRAYCPAAGFEAAAAQNRASLRTLEFAPFGRAEHGWEIYAPAITQEIGSECPPETAQFAARLAAWQARHGVGSSGVLDAVTFAQLKSTLQGRRPFLKIRGDGLCPDSPEEDRLSQASPTESRWDKPIKLRPGALGAYRRMVAAAKQDVPQLAVEPELLRIFSAYRSPVSDDARCASDGNCNGLVRAACSAHRTGLAMDIMVGHAPGSRADSTEDFNRLYQSRTAVYRWLIANAGRFGFVNYPFEPWHWEWTGELMTASGRAPAPTLASAQRIYSKPPSAPTPTGEGTPTASTGFEYAKPPGAASLAYVQPPSATPSTHKRPSAGEALDPVAALLNPDLARSGGEGAPAGLARTYARSWSEGPSPPPPSSPADPGPPGK